MRRSLVAIFKFLLGSALSALILLAGCNPKNPAEGIGGNNDPSQKPTPMSRPSTSSPNPIPGPITYVALGDSTGAGIGARQGGYVARLFRRMVELRPGSRLTNLCFSGATTSDVLSRQLARGIRADPNLVTLGIGINDIGHGLSVEYFSKNYDEILSSLKNNTRATVVVSNIPDISSAPRIPPAIRNEYHQRIVRFNQTLEEIAQRHGAIVFDVYTMTHEQLRAHPEYFSDDGFHPSDQGYESWAEHMWPTIAGTIGSDASWKR